MWKKFISYSIIFSVLHSNMTWASGNGSTDPEYQRVVGVQHRPAGKMPSNRRVPMPLPQAKQSSQKPLSQQRDRSLKDFASMQVIEPQNSPSSSATKITLSDQRKPSSDSEESEYETPTTTQSSKDSEMSSTPSPTKQSPRDEKTPSSDDELCGVSILTTLLGDGNSQTSSLIGESPLDTIVGKGQEGKAKTLPLGVGESDSSNPFSSPSLSLETSESISGENSPETGNGFKEPSNHSAVSQNPIGHKVEKDRASSGGEDKALSDRPGEERKLITTNTQRGGKGKAEAPEVASPLIAPDQTPQGKGQGTDEKTPLLKVASSGGAGTSNKNKAPKEAEDTTSLQGSANTSVKLDEEDDDIQFSSNAEGKSFLGDAEVSIQLWKGEQKSLTKFIPDCCKEEVLLPVKKWDSSSSLIEQISSDDQEEGPKTATHVLKKRFEHLLSELSPEARASLKDPVEMWEKVLAMLGGASLGGATAFGLGRLYTQSMLNLATQFDDDFIELIAGHGLFYYIVFSSIPDAAIRNAHYGKKALSYLSSRGATWKEVLFLGAVTFLPSLMTPFALISAGFEEIKFFPFPEAYKRAVKIMLGVSPILYLNDWGFNINVASEIKEWAQTSDSRFARILSGRAFYASLPSEEAVRERDFNKKLNLLLHNLPLMSDEDINEFYEIITNAKSLITKGLPELDPDNHEAAQTFLTLLYLLSEGDEMERLLHLSHKSIINPTQKQGGLNALSKVIEEDSQTLSPVLVQNEEENDHKALTTKSWYEAGTDYINYFLLGIGSVGRLITLKYVMHDVLHNMILAIGMLVGHPAAAANIDIVPLSWLIATVLASPIQTGLEYDGMQKAFKMMYSKYYEGHESYPWARALVKLYSLAQGFILTVPIGVLALQAFTEQFGEDWLWDPEHTEREGLLAFILAYLIPEWAVQTTLIEEAYNQTILTGAADICHSSIVWPKIAGLRGAYNSIQPINCLKWESNLRSYQQDWAIRFVKEKQKDMHNLHPEILFRLEQLLHTRNQKEI